MFRDICSVVCYFGMFGFMVLGGGLLDPRRPLSEWLTFCDPLVGLAAVLAAFLSGLLALRLMTHHSKKGKGSDGDD
jgi:hypothetical protein